jgi:hypothetical protein
MKSNRHTLNLLLLLLRASVGAFSLKGSRASSQLQTLETIHRHFTAFHRQYQLVRVLVFLVLDDLPGRETIKFLLFVRQQMPYSYDDLRSAMLNAVGAEALGQGLTLVHFSAQPEPFLKREPSLHTP